MRPAYIPITRKISKMPDFWTNEEMDRIFEHVPIEARPAFIFGRYAGLRKVELCSNVRWENCFWNYGYGIIDRPKVEASGMDTSKFIITSQLLEAVKPYMQSKGFICDINYERLSKIFSKARKKAEINTPGGSVKILRHSLARNLLLSGNDIFFVKEMLRHSDISTTQIYLSFKPKVISDIISLRNLTT